MVRCLIMFTKKNNIQYLILRDTQLPRYFKRVILIRQKNYRCYGHRLPTSLTLLMILVVPCWRNKTPCKVRHFGNQTGKAWKLKFLGWWNPKIQVDTTWYDSSTRQREKKKTSKNTPHPTYPLAFFGGVPSPLSTLFFLLWASRTQLWSIHSLTNALGRGGNPSVDPAGMHAAG